MRLNFILAGILAIMSCGAQAGGVYRWVDEAGKVHYGDTRAPEVTTAEKKKFGSSQATGDEGLTFETRRAKQHFPVTLYVTDSCGDPCKQARNLLSQRGVPFTEKNLTTQEDINAFRKMTGADNVPVLYVGKNILKGFQNEQWNGELDAAGYPKHAAVK
jgi:glutaredoxin